MTPMPFYRWLDVPPLWLLATMALAFWIDRRWPVAVPEPWSGAMMSLGGLLILAGLALMAWALATMMRARTTPVPHQRARKLVVRGPFRRSRNPIYLGDALVLTGFALVLTAPYALALVPLFMALITLRFIRPEEARLAEDFPDQFPHYFALVRRWL